MKIELWSDVGCPFCYIGKTRFENALNRFDLFEEEYVKKLLRDWRKYSKSEGINIYGKNKSDEKSGDEKHD